MNGFRLAEAERLRKVRAAQSTILPNRKAVGGKRPADRQYHRKQTAVSPDAVRVKRRCKRPPAGWRQTVHGKPYGLKDQISSEFRAARPGFAFGQMSERVG